MNLKSWTTTFTLILLLLLLLLLHLIMIIILFINYFQSQWVKILSPSTTPPLTIDPKKSLPHPQFHLRCKLSTWSELSRHLMAIIVSLPTLVTAHWQRQRIRLTTSGCRWGLISRANKNHLPMKCIIRTLYALFIFARSRCRCWMRNSLLAWWGV